jgi:hypothetical protein
LLERQLGPRERCLGGCASRGQRGRLDIADALGQRDQRGLCRGEVTAADRRADEQRVGFDQPIGVAGRNEPVSRARHELLDRFEIAFRQLHVREPEQRAPFERRPAELIEQGRRFVEQPAYHGLAMSEDRLGFREIEQRASEHLAALGARWLDACPHRCERHGLTLTRRSRRLGTPLDGTAPPCGGTAGRGKPRPSMEPRRPAAALPAAASRDRRWNRAALRRHCPPRQAATVDANMRCCSSE